MRPEIILHSEAGYIFADCSRRNRFFLQLGGRPHMLRQLDQAHPPGQDAPALGEEPRRVNPSAGLRGLLFWDAA